MSFVCTAESKVLALVNHLFKTFIFFSIHNSVLLLIFLLIIPLRLKWSPSSLLNIWFVTKYSKRRLTEFYRTFLVLQCRYQLLYLFFGLRWRFPPLPWDFYSISQWSCSAPEPGTSAPEVWRATNEPPHHQPWPSVFNTLFTERSAAPQTTLWRDSNPGRGGSSGSDTNYNTSLNPEVERSIKI